MLSYLLLKFCSYKKILLVRSSVVPKAITKTSFCHEFGFMEIENY